MQDYDMVERRVMKATVRLYGTKTDITIYLFPGKGKIPGFNLLPKAGELMEIGINLYQVRSTYLAMERWMVAR
jgi:hypothetical protein